jgi:general secretion pathway protein L
MNNAISRDKRAGADFQLAEFARQLGAGFRQLHGHPALAWITPQFPVRLIEATGGGRSLWLGGTKRDATEAALRSARFTAVEVPGDLALIRRFALPQMSERDLQDAVAMEVRDSNPFDPADLVWGYRSTEEEPGKLDVTTVLAARSQVVRHIEQLAPEQLQSPSMEAWVIGEDGVPVVLRGFGEAARARRAARGRVVTYALMALALLLATAVAVTPTVQLHLRALQAAAAYQALQQKAGPAVAQREALVRGREDLANLQEVMNEHIEPLVALETLTHLVPDDTWLQRVQAQGPRFTLTGQTPNAAALMNTLSSNPGLREVKAPAPATRASANRENFVLEFTMAPGMLRLPSAVAGTGALAAAPAATPPVPAPLATASQAPLPQAAASQAMRPTVPASGAMAPASQAARPAVAASGRAQP